MTPSEIQKVVVDGLLKKLEDIFIEGLKLKGFEFDNPIELERFIKKHCRCEDYLYLKQKTYFVNDIPFLIHFYEIVYEPITVTNNGIQMSANYGTYKYL